METKDEKRREKIRLEMLELDRQANKKRAELKIIDAKYEQARRDKIIGKCYKIDEYSGYARVEGFSHSDIRPIGTKVSFYGKGKSKSFHLDLNADFWLEDVEKGTQISHSQFNKYLLEAKSNDKNKIMETTSAIKRSDMYNDILKTVKKLQLADSEGDSFDHPSIAYELEQLFLRNTPFNPDNIKGEYYIETKIVTGGTLGYNDNLEIIKGFERMGFKYKGEPVTQDNNIVHWTIMEKNHGLIK